MRTTLAWLAHLYTALGLVCAAGIAVLIVRGDDPSFRLAFFLMMVATVIDATGGWLARKARVKETLPGFDGSTLDNLIDFHTDTSLPLLASGYGFSQVKAKTADGFFIGFPSYWNIVAFYLYVLHPAAWVSGSLLLLFSVLTFVPTPYLYASRGGPFATVVNVGAAIWFVMLGLVLRGAPFEPRSVALVSMAYPLLYLALSAVVTVQRRRTSAVSRSV